MVGKSQRLPSDDIFRSCPHPPPLHQLFFSPFPLPWSFIPSPLPSQVFLNGQRLPIKTFQEYVEQYLGPKENGIPRIYERFSDRWEVCISTTEGQFNQV